MNGSVGQAVVGKMIAHYGGQHIDTIGGEEIWQHGYTIIRVPTRGRVDWDVFEEIAKAQVGLSDWEFDFYVGEHLSTRH